MPSTSQRYTQFERSDWAALRAATPMTLEQHELEALWGINDRLDLDEVAEVYLPLSRLLNLRVAATQQLSKVTATFLGALDAPAPYIIGIAGSVAVGKSTIARLLQALLARWPNHPRVDLVTTDGFLYPNQQLIDRGIMDRKGFPESYDQGALIQFLAEIKAGEVATAPVYSHTVYDIVADESLVVAQPDVLIIEGLNVLQTQATTASHRPSVFVSDYFDFSIYVSAEEDYVEQWYVDRFLTLRETVFQDEKSFFHRYSELTRSEAIHEARRIWHSINGPNLHSNIAPTRDRADLVLVKGESHRVEEVWLRKR